MCAGRGIMGQGRSRRSRRCSKTGSYRHRGRQHFCMMICTTACPLVQTCVQSILSVQNATGRWPDGRNWMVSVGNQFGVLKDA